MGTDIPGRSHSGHTRYAAARHRCRLGRRHCAKTMMLTPHLYFKQISREMMKPAFCLELHALVATGTVHRVPFESRAVPMDGVYALFETGETAHGGPRIVRVGTHTGDGQLPSRLLQHFVNENKDRSIFRKNIGRALLAKAGDLYLAEWEIDRTSRAASPVPRAPHPWLAPAHNRVGGGR